MFNEREAQYQIQAQLHLVFLQDMRQSTLILTAMDLRPSRSVVGARDAEHIGKIYEGFCRPRMPAAASL
jgi:hypothetical protein